MIKQNSKEEILREPGVDILRVKKKVRFEEDSDNSYEDQPGRIRLTNHNSSGARKKRISTFSVLSINLILIAAVLIGFNMFVKDKPSSVTLKGYRISLHAYGFTGKILCIADIIKSDIIRPENGNVNIKFFQGTSVFSIVKPLPKTRGERLSLTGAIDSHEEKAKVFAEIDLDHDKTVLSAAPQTE